MHKPAQGIRHDDRCGTLHFSRLFRAIVCALATLAPPYADSAETKYGHLLGRVTISPSCAGPQQEGEQCRAPWAGADVQLIDGAGKMLDMARTGVDGRFELVGPAGLQTVHVVSRSKVVRCEDASVQLHAGRRVVLTVDCDSGMR